ncbi:MAG: metallophosphoesterase [Gemmatimonadota bacterium]
MRAPRGLSILHVSDLHLGPPFMPEVAEALLARAAALEPDVVVASGDFTQRAKPEQFEAARAFLNRLPTADLVTVPGNHDVPLYRVLERLFTPLDLYREHIHPELNWVLEREDAVIVALDSTRPRRHITNGRIDAAQLELCERSFAAAGERARIVVAHHHFAPAPDYERSEVMPRARYALDRFTAMRVDLILGGHLHRGYIGDSLDVYAGADAAHGIIIVQSGTTTSRRGRAREAEKNSFNVIRVGAHDVRVTHYMHFDEQADFEPISEHRFPRPGLGFFREGPAGASP